MDLSDFETRLLLPKEKRGQGLSRNTVRSVHFFLRGAYNYWVKSGVCEMNPLFYVEPPAEEKHEAVALDEWDYPGLDEAITASLHPDELNEKTMREAAYAFAAWLALHTGMRVGEVWREAPPRCFLGGLGTSMYAARLSSLTAAGLIAWMLLKAERAETFP